MRTITFYNEKYNDSDDIYLTMTVDDNKTIVDRNETIQEFLESLYTTIDEILYHLNYHPDYDSVKININYEK